MIPVLYKEEETEFITQGIGALSDAISCKVVEELNGSYELTMQYPVTGLHFSDIILNRLILADHAPSRQSEPFQIYKISKPINGIVTIYAEHISYRLSYVPVSPFTANNCVEALNGLKEHADEPCQFTLYTDKSTIAEYKQIVPHSFRELLGGVDGSILDTYRGEYEFNRFNIRFTQHRGVYKKSASIRYGKNLTDLKQEESIENTVTGIYPYWQGTKTITSTSSDGETVSKTEDVVVTLPEKIIYSENKDKYSYHRTIPKDFAYRFQDKPTEAQLRAATQSYVKEIGVPEVNLTVSFLSLASMEENKHFADETVYLGDTVPIEFIKLGIMTDAEIIKATYDTLMDRYDTLELGTTSSSLSKTIVAMQKKYESAVQKSQLDQVINEQQLKISGGLGGSVVTTYSNNEPSETVYGDTNDVKTMLNCMRVNKSGIAFSNNGYSGPYNSAWTIDGKFNADFIQAGHINGNLITGNTIKAGALDTDLSNTINSSLSNATVEWYVSSSPTELSGGSWSEERPVWTEKNYIWQRLKSVNKKGEISYSQPSCVQGNTGAKGEQGVQGIQGIQGESGDEIYTLRTQWYLSESSSELVGGEWLIEEPAYIKDHHYWSRTHVIWDTKDASRVGVIKVGEKITYKESYTQPVLSDALSKAYKDAMIANENATNASTSASKALASALAAEHKANDASSKADGAVSSANNANNLANQAVTDSKDAQDKAKEIQKASDEATAKAKEAIEGFNRFDQVIKMDNTGLKIKASADENANTMQLTNDGMQISAAEKVVAEYTATQSRVNNLVAENYLYTGAHRFEKTTMNTQVGTGVFYVG